MIVEGHLGILMLSLYLMYIIIVHFLLTCQIISRVDISGYVPSQSSVVSLQYLFDQMSLFVAVSSGDIFLLNTTTNEVSLKLFMYSNSSFLTILFLFILLTQCQQSLSVYHFLPWSNTHQYCISQSYAMHTSPNIIS